MIEEEFLRVNERPDNILISLAPGGGRLFVVFGPGLSGDVVPSQAHFLFIRSAGASRQVKFADFFLVTAAGVGGQARGGAFVVGQFFLNFLGVEQMETLRE